MHTSHGVRSRALACGLALLLALGTAPVVAPAAPVAGNQATSANSVAPDKALQLPGAIGLSARQQTQVRSDLTASGGEDAVVIAFEPGKGLQALSKVRGRGGRLKRHAKTGGFFVAYVPEGRPAAEFAASLEGIEGVRYAEPDSVVRASFLPDDPSYPSQWGLPKIGAPAAWNVTTGSPSVTIAIVDTGVRLTHPDLAGRINTTNDYDFVNDDEVADDDQGHGTHCAGIAAASTNNANQVAGVAGACTILPVKVLAADGSGLESDVADGIKWAADRGADVISLSLEADSYSAVLDDAVQYAVAKDCVVVAAAGNSGSPYGVSYPARLPNVLAVGSTLPTDERSSFSNYGPGLDLCAPGSEILSTTSDGEVGWMSGTSMATPHVAGVAALVRSENPMWTRSQVEQRLTSTALDLGTPGLDDEFGYGLVQAGAAVDSTTPPPPLPDPDDSIPGVELPASSVGGSVDSFTDVYDVYQIALSSGQTLSAGLTSSFVEDIDLHLYGPDATSLADEPLASSESPGSSEEIAHAVSRSGVYYLAVMAYSGSGGYTLTYSVTGSAQPDDEIPGIPAPASPIADSLTEPTDVDDVYGLSLAEGQRLSVSLTGPAGTDFDVRLFAPDAISIWGDEPVAQAADISYPDALTYNVPANGVYYLDVRSHAGSGDYTVTYSAITPPPPEADDDIPGVPIGPSPRVGTVDQSLDPIDVYSISLDGGKRLTLDITGPAGTDFDVVLYGPEALSIGSATPRASGTGGTYPEQVRYQVPSLGGGTYYVAVRAYSGAGDYELTYGVEDTTEVALLEDDFETWPGPWSVWSPSGATWGGTAYRTSAGSYSAYCAGSSVAAPGPYQDAMDAWLTAGPFDLSDYDGATLTFDMWLDSEADFDELSVGASTDDGTYKTLVWSGSSGGWTTVTLDLGDLSGDGTLDYTGQPAVWIGFIFNSNESLAYEGAYVDNVRLSGTRIVVPNTAPVLDPIGDRTADELALLSFTATATDFDGDPLTFSLGEGAPSGAAITSGGAFSWTPTEEQDGVHSITVVVTDEHGATDSETITVTVNEVPDLTTIPLEHDAAGVVFDRFVTGYSTAYSGGGYVYSRWAGTTLKASFTGSSISWIGPKQPSYGMADVYIDGAKVASDVDCYQASPGSLSATIWQSGTLADGPHTIEIRLAGHKNAASSGNVVVLDKFELTGSSPSGGGTRYDDFTATPGYTGTWLHYVNPTYFNKTYAYSRWSGAAFTVSFTGTQVSWIGPKTPNYGMADVYIDDVKVAKVDCYKADLASQGWREVIWTSNVLTPGAHTLSIRPTGTKNVAATAANVVVDAVDVRE